MTRANLQPLYFGTEASQAFHTQLERLRDQLNPVAQFLAPLPFGADLSRTSADLILLPQLSGAAYQMLEVFRSQPLPMVVLTSEFCSTAIWDWEITGWLRSAGIDVFTPYEFRQTEILCRAVAAKRELSQSRFLVFQDDIGAGLYADMFQRFYWWQRENSQRMFERFGISVEERSLLQLTEAVRGVSDDQLRSVWEVWQPRLPIVNVPDKALDDTLRLYVALKRLLAEEPQIQGLGINCINEFPSMLATPCLVWNMLYQDHQLIWGCEADTLSMMTQHLVDRCLATPAVMTNIYPFLVGQPVLDHMDISAFPKVADARNYLLAGHCGYLGVLPQSYAVESWALRPSVIDVFEGRGGAIDGRLPLGEMLLVKLNPDCAGWTVIEGDLEDYHHVPQSGLSKVAAVIRVGDGPALLDQITSQHYILTQGAAAADFKMLAKVFGMDVNWL
ncbi:MAG: hypothetical protein OXG68_17900 [Chloroflexi bacterium]|nr:hypothetical protein [Chloroflexota bacterium]